MFVGRKKELEKLEKLCAAEKQKFVAVYGRRRIGKTVLLEEFMKGKEGIRFVAFRGSRELLYRSLLDMTNSFFAPDGPKYAFNDPDELFAFIFSKSLTSQFTFIIDEYAYLAEFSPKHHHYCRSTSICTRKRESCFSFSVHHPDLSWKLRSWAHQVLSTAEGISH